ncbi:MAG: helix-turn-helix domain-containing protein [Kordiimonas sp.]
MKWGFAELTEKAQLDAYTDGPLKFVASGCNSVFVTHSKFHEYEGEVGGSRYLKIALNVGQKANYYSNTNVGIVDEDWRRNGIVLTLPNDVGSGHSSTVSMTGIAVDLDAFPFDSDQPYTIDAFSHLVSKITMDPVAARYIKELMGDAELHGCSSAFFSDRLNLLMRRLTAPHSLSLETDTNAAPLDEWRLNRVIDLMEADLGNDLTVSDMAKEVSMDLTNFSKAFRGATGMPPYAYLTQRRMNAAQTMLQLGQNVTSIAMSLNYSNPSKFSAAFKRYIGQSPSTWIKEKRS